MATSSASSVAPPTPRTILRGHRAQVHATAFVRGNNDRLVTGDADGFVVVWDLTIVRPRAVWRAHGDVILGVCGWGHDRLITHGRDNKLIVWQLSERDEAGMDTTLPLDPVLEERRRPWILFSLPVHTMNFCTFSLVQLEPISVGDEKEALIAVPNTLDNEAIDIHHLPSGKIKHIVLLGRKEGMVMALQLVMVQGLLTLVVGYENGATVVAQEEYQGWTVLYYAKAHTQPVLSLAVAPTNEYFLTSSADALVVKHPLPQGRRIRETSTNTSQSTNTETSSISAPKNEPASLLSLAREAPAPQPKPTISSTQIPPPSPLIANDEENPRRDPSTFCAPTRAPPGIFRGEPLKTVNTKHAGQQGLRIRNDGRVFATAGWDGRVRVYSAKTMRELAVLKWHQVGCYTVAFADVGDTEGIGAAREGVVGTTGSLVPRVGDVSVKERRIEKAKTAHWIAVGAKDGKVSLWEVY